ncbi:MAG: peptidase sortase [Acidimicrobiales bacterium]|nr:peptidase sortase [Acidimicrobiales bacterium]
MTRRRVALLVVAIALLGLAATAALSAGGGSAPEAGQATAPTAKDSDPTYGGPTPTFEEDESRDVEGNVSGGRIPVFTHRSARLEDLVPPVVVKPVRLRIPSLEVDAPVGGVGIEPVSYELDVPDDERLVSWYQHGPSPGAKGSALLAGHVDFDGRAGVFYRLRWLDPGQRFEVGYEDGTSRTFEVVGRRQFEKRQLPTTQLFSEDGDPTVVLVTCGGEFDEGRRSYSDNLVVYGTPVAS